MISISKLEFSTSFFNSLDLKSIHHQSQQQFHLKLDVLDK